jgi:hypothetical protein
MASDALGCIFKASADATFPIEEASRPSNEEVITGRWGDRHTQGRRGDELHWWSIWHANASPELRPAQSDFGGQDREFLAALPSKAQSVSVKFFHESALFTMPGNMIPSLVSVASRTAGDP